MFLVAPPLFHTLQETDPHFGNVLALLHGEGSNGSTTFTDSSPSPKSITRTNGTATSISTADFKFGAASIQINGNNDRLTTPYSADWVFGTGNLTIETWAKLTVAPLTFERWLFTRAYSGTNYLCMGISNSRYPCFHLNNTAYVATVAQVELNSWYHFALVRNGNTWTFYLDGASAVSGTNSINLSSTNTTPIGFGSYGHADTGNVSWRGFMDEFRVTKGVARYTSDFTPPTRPFPDA